MQYTPMIDRLELRTINRLETNSIEIHGVVRGPQNNTFLSPAVLGAPQPIRSDIPAPALNLTFEQAARLYLELGRALGKIDSEALQAASKAQAAHIADLREIVLRLVK
jgi:hypothetical protein